MTYFSFFLARGGSGIFDHYYNTRSRDSVRFDSLPFFCSMPLTLHITIPPEAKYRTESAC